MSTTLTKSQQQLVSRITKDVLAALQAETAPVSVPTPQTAVRGRKVVAVDLTVYNTALAYALSAECPDAYRVTISRSGRLYFHDAENRVLSTRLATPAELKLRKGRAANGVTRR